MEFNYIELVGYTASLIILISFILKDVTKLRIVNTVGCIFFVAYGFLLNPTSWPIIITNVAIIIVNLYYLLSPKK